MVKSAKRIGILTGGGDCPGLNAVIRAVAKPAIASGIEVLGIEDGYLGLIEERLRPLTNDDVSGILTTGGTILGRLGVEVFGFAIELNITVRRVPGHAPGTYEPLTVSVKAVEPGVSSPDKYRVEELRRLEKQYLDLVGERAMCARVVE